MDSEIVHNQIDYPKQTSECGRILIDILNNHLGKVQEQIQTINNNFDDKFDNFQKSLDEIKTIAEENKKEIDNIKSNVCFLEFTCDRLANENKMLKKHTINLENYSRRKNVVIRGISENRNESNTECEEKTRKCMINELKLDDDKVKKD